MKIINLENFKLEEIDITKQQHLDVIKKFDNDSLVKKYLYPYKDSFYDLVSEGYKTDNIFNTFYIIYFGVIPVGYVEIESPKETFINYALLKSERKRGYAQLFLKELYEYLFENTDIKSFNLIIRSDNIDSIKVAKKVGLTEVPYSDTKFQTFKKTR